MSIAGLPPPDDPEDGEAEWEWRRRCDPRHDPEEFLNTVSMSLVILGLLLITVGYVYPRNYEFDPYEAARVMEAIEAYYSDLSYGLDVTIVTGMALVGIGGILYAVLFIRTVSEAPSGGCCEGEPEGQDIPLQRRGSWDRAKSGVSPGYGATDDTAQTLDTP